MKTLKAYALSFIGIPYLWGGNNPIEGFDCSGFVQELLASVGLDPIGRQDAQELYEHFKKDLNHCETEPSLGALAFFGKPEKIIHVAFCLDNTRMVEAGGGNPSVINLASAARNNAFVKIRPISHRRDLVALLKPIYLLEQE